jgi:hypothetical protein
MCGFDSRCTSDLWLNFMPPHIDAGPAARPPPERVTRTLLIYELGRLSTEKFAKLQSRCPLQFQTPFSSLIQSSRWRGGHRDWWGAQRALQGERGHGHQCHPGLFEPVSLGTWPCHRPQAVALVLQRLWRKRR